MPPFAFDPARYPTTPGCYLMKDRAGHVLYVGKAKSLRDRLSSYFQAGPKHPRTRQLLARVRGIEIILVNNEVESLVLEHNLIKRYRPRYNRHLVPDDEGYPYIVLTGEDLPRLLPYRRNRVNKKLDSACGQAVRRFGPYVTRRFRDVLLEYTCEAFGLRTCRDVPTRACLRYHLGRCGGICECKVTAEDYARGVEQAVVFLSRAHGDLLREIRARMLAHAERLEFEQAQRLRDQALALEATLESQIVERDLAYDQDVIYFGERHALIMEVRRGAVWGLCLFDLDPGLSSEQATERLLLCRYARACPEELIANRLPDPARLGHALAEASRHGVRLTLPEEGVAHDLLQLCALNYAYQVPGEPHADDAGDGGR